MKKIVAGLLCCSLLFLTGCSNATPSAETEIELPLAVETSLLSLYGAEQQNVVKTYGLSEDRKDNTWSKYYLADITWCGEKRETKFLFADDILTYAKSGIVIPNDGTAHETVSSILTQFHNQFGEPISITSQFDWVPEPKQYYQAEKLESALQSFWNAENGALLCVSYPTDEISSELPCYIECAFLRNENTNSGDIYIILLVGNASFGLLNENTNLDLLI